MSLTGRHIVFRTDASVRIGSGHVMRCLTLADALQGAGAHCRFVMRDHPGHLETLVQERGYDTFLLPPGDGASDGGLPHAAWLGTDWQTDADQTRTALADIPADLMVVDHYALDRRWQAALADCTSRWMVIDDLADRPFIADVLLDQNLGANAENYTALLPTGATQLIGPRYALLRPQFTIARAQMTDSLGAAHPPRILIAVSGTDADNISERLLDQMDAMTMPPDAEITVILGASAPHITAVRARAERMRTPTRLLVGVDNMSRVFADADLCIGAAGGMSWERCCMGLPTLLLILADNQIKSAEALAHAEAGEMIGDVRVPGWEIQFKETLHTALNSARCATLRQRALEICDGYGTARIVGVLQSLWGT